MATARLHQIEAPHFVAGLVSVDGRVADCAPILSYMRGWTLARVRVYAKRKGWAAADLRRGAPPEGEKR